MLTNMLIVSFAGSFSQNWTNVLQSIGTHIVRVIFNRHVESDNGTLTIVCAYNQCDAVLHCNVLSHDKLFLISCKYSTFWYFRLLNELVGAKDTLNFGTL